MNILRYDHSKTGRDQDSVFMDPIPINHANPPLDDVRVRQALAQAIDIDAIIKTVTFGYGTPANSYAPAGGMYYSPDNMLWSHDQEIKRPDRSDTVHNSDAL